MEGRFRHQEVFEEVFTEEKNGEQQPGGEDSGCSWKASGGDEHHEPRADACQGLSPQACLCPRHTQHQQPVFMRATSVPAVTSSCGPASTAHPGLLTASLLGFLPEPVSPSSHLISSPPGRERELVQAEQNTPIPCPGPPVAPCHSEEKPGSFLWPKVLHAQVLSPLDPASSCPLWSLFFRPTASCMSWNTPGHPLGSVHFCPCSGASCPAHSPLLGLCSNVTQVAFPYHSSNLRSHQYFSFPLLLSLFHRVPTTVSLFDCCVFYFVLFIIPPPPPMLKRHCFVNHCVPSLWNSASDIVDTQERFAEPAECMSS